MHNEDYESLSYRMKFIRAVRAGFITLAVCLLVLFPAFYLWKESVTQRQILREAKNVVLNMNLLAAQFIAMGEPVRDVNRMSGLTEEAEKAIRSHSGAEGAMQLISWDYKNGRVSAINYYRDKYYIVYRCDGSEETTTWDVYRQVRHHQNNGE